MVYMEQHIVLGPDVQQRLDAFSAQLSAFSGELPSYIEALDKRIEWSLKNTEEAVRVAGRFASGLEALAKVGIGILIALVVLIVVGCVLIREIGRMGEEGKREIRKRILQGELKGE